MDALMAFADDIKALNLTIQDLIRAERDLVAAMQKAGSAPGGGQGGAGAQAGAQSQGAAAANAGTAGRAQLPSPGQAPQKTDSAAGFGLSMARTAFAAGGSSGLASVVSGFAAGGPAGALGAAAAVGVGTIAKEYGYNRNAPFRQLEAGLSAYEGSSVNDTEAQANRRAKFAVARQKTVDEESKLDADSNTVYRRENPQGYLRKKKQLAATRRGLEQSLDELQGPEDRARALTERQFAGFARAGGFSGEGSADARELLAERFQINLQRERNYQELHSALLTRDRWMLTTGPGAQGSRVGE